MSRRIGPVRVVVDGFGFRYAGRTEWAIRDAEFRIEPGERILLTGPSGAGKSTLLAAMAGLLGPDAGDARGSVRVDRTPAAQARERVGILFQDPDSQLVMSRAGDDVAFSLENRGVSADEIWPRVREALDAVGFGYALDRSTHALSGGEKQRLVLAGAIVSEPGLLLLDEPTSQLDHEGARLVRDAVARILARRETTLVLIDHDAGPWIPLIDRVLEVHFDATQGTPATLGTYQGAPESVQIGPERSEGIRELNRSWRPSVPALPVRNPSHDPSPDHPVRAERAGFSYPGDEAARPALAPTDVELTAGQVTAITGPNGSGTSTLGLLLDGPKAPAGGRVVASPKLAGPLGDRPPHRWRARDLVHRIGTVFQNPEHQFLAGRVRDELSLGSLRAGAGNHAAHDRAEELLARLGLTAYAEANPFTLSGGQQRRLSVAAALATRPGVLILDEPTFGQDQVTWEELLRLLAEARDDGAALCLISHDTRLVAGFADHELRLGEPRPIHVDHRKREGFSASAPPETRPDSDDQPGFGGAT
ncbi:ABC transporter ATP-binding protein [soil metagenome]